MDNIYINYKEKIAFSKLCLSLEDILSGYSLNKIVILCIGTDRCTGDSLGPLVGYKLKHLNLKNVYVYGSLDEPVHAGNLVEAIDNINSEFDDPFIIAIDACLGSYEHIGSICLKKGPLCPGAAMKKALPPVGNINITGIVNMYGFLDSMVLQSTRLCVVMSIAELIASSLRLVLKSLMSKDISECYN